MRYIIHVDKRQTGTGTDIKADLFPTEAKKVRDLLQTLYDANKIYDFGFEEEQAPGFESTVTEINRIAALR